MTHPTTIGRALSDAADHRHMTELLDAITGISADPEHRRSDDDGLMSDARFGRFEPPITLTEQEWAALDAVRRDGDLRDAATRLGVAERRFRLIVKNAAEKLRLAAST